MMTHYLRTQDHRVEARFDLIANAYQKIQEYACNQLEVADGKGRFSSDAWKKDIGWGLTRVMQNGNIIEKAAINFSRVSGPLNTGMASVAGREGKNFSATGLSSIIHPINPHLPIIHMNVRYFELDNGENWFGGGIDLTPHYVVKEDAIHFHQQLKQTCDTYHPGFYPQYKKWADDYFFIKHRNETRGVGGIFFDQLEPGKECGFDALFNFTCELGKTYPDIYTALMKKYGNREYTQREKEWQLIRRGRYVEFNLVYDRGTRFGMESGGNTESILVSMPPEVKWPYHYEPEEGSREGKTLEWLKKGIDWVNIA
jgi:coproporphyrinogen III oxidase